jgi:hypothetical protein
MVLISGQFPIQDEEKWLGQMATMAYRLVREHGPSKELKQYRIFAEPGRLDKLSVKWGDAYNGFAIIISGDSDSFALLLEHDRKEGTIKYYVGNLKVGSELIAKIPRPTLSHILARNINPYASIRSRTIPLDLQDPEYWEDLYPIETEERARAFL